MTVKKTQIALGIGLAFASSMALAEPMTPNSGVNKGDILTTFESIDRDADGRISRAEARPSTLLSGDFIKLDRNSDGFLNPGEFKLFSIPSRAGTATTSADPFGWLDTNHNGSMSKEFTASVDSNKNPPVSLERKSSKSLPPDTNKNPLEKKN